MKVERPWGSYEILSQGKGFKVKCVEVFSGKRISLQKHHHRSEHWVVVEGIAKITNKDEVKYIGENQSTYIPKEGLHRLENSTDKPLRIIEIQCGDYLKEDDIERFDDDFGRV